MAVINLAGKRCSISTMPCLIASRIISQPAWHLGLCDGWKCARAIFSRTSTARKFWHHRGPLQVGRIGIEVPLREHRLNGGRPRDRECHGTDSSEFTGNAKRRRLKSSILKICGWYVVSGPNEIVVNSRLACGPNSESNKAWLAGP